MTLSASFVVLGAAIGAPSNATVCPEGLRGPGPFVQETRGGITLYRPQAVCVGEVLVAELEGCDDPWVVWRGDSFPTLRTEDRRHALLPVPLEAAAGTERLLVHCAERMVAFRVPVAEADYPRSELRVDPRYSKPPPPRVVEEQAAWTRAFASSSAERLWSGPFLRPVDNRFTAVFGVRRTFNDEVRSRHRGLDIDGARGTPIVATARGRVAMVARDFYFIGNAVLLDHGWGLFSLYGHMSRVDVEEGAMVEQGQILGAVGRTGRVTGPHVHFAVKLAGTYVDPELLLHYEPRPYGRPEGVGVPTARLE